MPPSKAGDKAEWSVAAKGLFTATLAGAKAGEEAFPEMELDELEINWAAIPKFLPTGEVLADTEDPDAVPFTTKALYKRARTPKLEE